MTLKLKSALPALFGATGLALVAVVAAGPAEARIKCVGGNQIVNGSPIATPYCQDELVAKVARERGVKVSAAEIRNNPNLKRNVCQHVGRDNRIYIACIDANSVGRRPF
jgi:DNA-binding IclR family transcriptional regulator